jgi:hypothetical protein
MKIIQFLLLGLGLADNPIPSEPNDEVKSAVTTTKISEVTRTTSPIITPIITTQNSIPPIVSTSTSSTNSTPKPELPAPKPDPVQRKIEPTKTAANVPLSTTTAEAVKPLSAPGFLKTDEVQFSAQSANTIARQSDNQHSSAEGDSGKLNGSPTLPSQGDKDTNVSTGHSSTLIALSSAFGVCILAIGGFIISKKREPVEAIESGFQSHEKMDSRPKHLSKQAFGYFDKFLKTPENSIIPFSNEAARLSVSTMASYCPPPALITRSNPNLNSLYSDAEIFYDDEDQGYVVYEKDDQLTDFKKAEIRNPKYDSHDFQISPFSSIQEEHHMEMEDHDDAAYLAAAASFAASQDSQGSSESKYDSMIISDDDESDFSSFVSSDY